MWILINNNWNRKHTSLSKYFVERVVQRVDSREIISNRHRTTSGFTLINEIVELCKILVSRPKSINRLISIIEEAVAPSLSSNVANDLIIVKYYSDIHSFYKSYSSDMKGKAEHENNLNDLTKDRAKLNYLLIKSQINLKRLESGYYSCLRKEADLIDLSNENHFRREAEKIDKLIDVLIPYLIFKGYSATTIFDFASKDLVQLDANNYLIEFMDQFSFKSIEFDFRISIPKDSLEGRFYDFIIKENNFIKSRYSKHQFDQVVIPKIMAIDPTSFVTKLFIDGIKDFVIREKNFEHVEFSKFFEEIKWKKHEDAQLVPYKNTISKHKIDAVNIKSRINTFETTIRFVKNENSYQIKSFEELKESLYYYNLGLNANSLENSFSLLWTSLECLIPYRLYGNDIQNVQYFVSKVLSVGSFGRDIASVAIRTITFNSVNRKSLNELNTNTFQRIYTSEGLFNWGQWIAAKIKPGDIDPYDILSQNSPLLCAMYCKLNEDFSNNNLSYLSERIKRSKEAISYQLDRMYLFRNQIVHSGAFIPEYTNLWGHLEWYVGKILSYLYLTFEMKNDNKSSKGLENSFLELEAEIDQALNFLSSNSDNKIVDHLDEIKILCQFPWMAI